MNQLASIIIPVYNAEPYLCQCLDSALNQTYKNIEVLVVDDGSTDNSGKICDSYCRDSRVTVFHQSNAGLSAARNTALNHVKGEYIFFLDSDDFVAPDFVSRAVASLETNHADIVLFNYFEYIQTDSGFQRKLIEETERLHGDFSLISLQKKMITADILCAVWNKGYRKHLFKNVLFPEGEWLEDMAIVPPLFLKAKKINVITNPLYYYRIHNLSYMHSIKYNVQRDYLMIVRFHQRATLTKSFQDPELSARLKAEVLDRSIELIYLNYYLNKLDASQLKWLNDLVTQAYEKQVLNRLGKKTKLMRSLILYFPSIARSYGKYRYKRKING